MVLVRTSASMGGALSGLIERALSPADLPGADLVLAVNAAGASPVSADHQPHRDVETHGRDLDAFVEELARDAALGRTIAIADIAYVGGRERALEDALARRGVVPAIHEHGDDALAVLVTTLRSGRRLLA